MDGRIRQDLDTLDINNNLTCDNSYSTDSTLIASAPKKACFSGRSTIKSVG